MTITEAIKFLEKFHQRHGDCEVKADCPKCGHVFEPNTVAAQRETVTAKLQEKA